MCLGDSDDSAMAVVCQRSVNELTVVRQVRDCANELWAFSLIINIDWQLTAFVFL